MVSTPHRNQNVFLNKLFELAHNDMNFELLSIQKVCLMFDDNLDVEDKYVDTCETHKRKSPTKQSIFLKCT